MDPTENPIEENRRLRRTMRDLVALSTLPAVWTGLGPEGIARSLAEVLLNTLSLEFVYVRLKGSNGSGVIEVVRTRRSDAAHVEMVRAAIAPLVHSPGSEFPSAITDPLGGETINVAVARFGVSDDHGVVVAGSRSDDFPTEQDRLLLAVGTNQTAIVVQRRCAEERVHEQQQRFSRFMQHLPGLAWIKDTQGRYVYVNDAAEKAFRTPRVELYGKTDDELFPPEVAARFSQNDRQAVASGGGIQVVETLEHEDGTLHYSLVTKFPIQAPDGEAAFVGGMAIDITARKRAEDALLDAHRELEDRVALRTAELAQANEFMKALLENVQTGVVACNADGVLTLFNGVTRVLHGLPEEPISPERWAERYSLFQPDGQTLMTQADVPLYRALQGERVQDAEMVIRPEGLSPRTVQVSGQAILDEKGVKIGAVVSMHDITARKRAEEELRTAHQELEKRVEQRTAELGRANEALQEADRRKDEFLATLAHELRNPLAPMRNSLQILKMPRVDAATVQQTRDMMERQVQHLVRLVDDLLDVSRVMRGKIELRRERVELATVVARAVETVQPLIEVQGHRLDLSLPHESLLLDADPVRLTQVVGNLLTNAAKYTEANGRIWLSATRENGQAVLTVRDSGIGIGPDMLPHIFELFVQVDHAATRSQGGLGIGLTLVKNLVEMHGGSVEAHSDGLGTGCAFTVRLPLTHERQEQLVPEIENDEQMPVRASGLRLLVVDDNKDAATSLAMLLRLQGHEVQLAHSGVSALELAPSYSPDVVFLDIGMPGMDGYEVARRLRRQPGLENVVLAALTGWGQEEDRRRTAEAGFNHHLVKPPEPKAVEDLLGRLSKCK